MGPSSPTSIAVSPIACTQQRKEYGKGGTFRLCGGEGGASLQISPGEELDAVDPDAPSLSLGGEGPLKDLELTVSGHDALIVNPQLNLTFSLSGAKGHSLTGRRGLQWPAGRSFKLLQLIFRPNAPILKLIAPGLA
jgi:hypothetical protein